VSAPGASDAIARLRDGDLTSWQGLPAGTQPADLEPAVDAPGDAPAMAGLGLRKALVRYGQLAGTDVDAEVWVSPASSEVWLVAIDDPPFAGAPEHVLQQLGPPALRLDNALGTVPLPGSEWVYPDRGLTVFADEEDERVWRVALFTPSRPEEYEERYRVFLGQRRR
jgi:hypothetical protein